MTLRIFFLLLLVVAAATSSAQSAWSDSSSAQRAAMLLEALLSEPTPQGLARLDSLEGSSSLNPAERDATALALVESLRARPPGSLAPELLDRLKNWSAQAWREHEESAQFLVPRFPVAAAARGLEHQWQWTEGIADVLGQGKRDFPKIVMRYAAQPDGPYARGVRRALDQVGSRRLANLTDAARADSRLTHSLLPELWLAAGEIDRLAEWSANAPARRVSELLTRATRQLASENLLLLAVAAQSHSDPSVRGLALARQTDAWLALDDWSAGWAAKLWNWLDDPALGSTAALQLARLDAPRHWRDDPSSAPAGALDAPMLQRVEALAPTLSNMERAGHE